MLGLNLCRRLKHRNREKAELGGYRKKEGGRAPGKEKGPKLEVNFRHSTTLLLFYDRVQGGDRQTLQGRLAATGPSGRDKERPQCAQPLPFSVVPPGQHRAAHQERGVRHCYQRLRPGQESLRGQPSSGRAPPPAVPLKKAALLFPSLYYLSLHL